ncbi:universal stress protein [Kribbella sp. NPDC002412]
MNTWARTGPVAVEIDGSHDDLRIVDYACMEALRSGAELILAAPYPAASRPMAPELQSASPEDLADAALRTAVAHIRHRYGNWVQLNAVSKEGSRQRVLPAVARHARMLVVGRRAIRGPQRLVAAQGNLFLAGRTGCPVVVVPSFWKPSIDDRKVAVGLDGTPLSDEALEFAFRAAAGREGDLIVVHSARRTDGDGAWIRRADQMLTDALAVWTAAYPRVRVTRFLTARDAVAALVHESQEVGLVVVGSHSGLLTIADPVTRRSVADVTCPVAIVPHHVAVAEREELLDRNRSWTAPVAPLY